MTEYEVYESPKSVAEAKDCIDEVIKIILESMKAKLTKKVENMSLSVGI